jgi:16S rRNA (cytidine1402-2'-O)-methyltransferase
MDGMEPGAGVPGGSGQHGALIVAAGPIGRPDDASPRLARALAETPIVAAEDTRRLRRLAAALGVRPAGKLVSYYDHVERQRTPDLLAALRGGADVLLVADAGTPGVSDPGYRLVAAAADAGIRVTALPGPSAVLTALAVSGLPSDRFCFEGFPPRRAGERARRLADLAAEPRTMIFFESPRRLAGTLGDLAGALGGDRRAVVCRELTKTHEEIRRRTLSSLAAWAASEDVLGEITLVVEGAPPGAGRLSVAEAVREVAERVAAGASRRDAVTAVAAEAGLPRRAVYAAVVREGQ